MNLIKIDSAEWAEFPEIRITPHYDNAPEEEEKNVKLIECSWCKK